jgi:hypothetical protein
MPLADRADNSVMPDPDGASILFSSFKAIRKPGFGFAAMTDGTGAAANS